MLLGNATAMGSKNFLVKIWDVFFKGSQAVKGVMLKV
jgi:hypothetical protein